MFYIVWCPTNPKTPSYRHYSEASASNEAKRLAIQYPDCQFYVLATVGMAEKVSVTYTNFRPLNEDDIPF